MTTLSLFDDTIQQRFERFHREHPEVAEALAELAFRALRAGRERSSIKMMYEVLRWERHLRGLPDPTEDYKLSNDYHSRYARLLMDKYPVLRGMFVLRELRSP